MKIRLKLFTLFLCILFVNAFSQEGVVNRLVQEGIEKYDNGDFKGALESYLKALEIDETSPLANYEIASTYYVMEQYDKSIKHSDKVIKINKDYVDQAYILKGTVLDVSGKPKDAVKVYRKGIKEYPQNHLLQYNLALTLYGLKEYKETEEALQAALTIRPTHASSHFLMGVIMQEQQFKVKSLLALYNFLLIEPASKRSINALKVLNAQVKSNVKKDGDNNTTITLSMGGDEEFRSAELMISLMEASKNTEENKNKTDAVLFYEHTKMLFSILDEKGKSGFWWKFYVDFFNTLLEKSDVEAFSYYVSQSKNDPIVQDWLKANTDKTERLQSWFKSYERSVK